MTIYTQQGLRSKKLTAIRAEDPFNWLTQYKPKELAEGASIKDEKPRAEYFISGHIEPDENGNINRGNDSLIQRDFLVVDYDDLELSYTDLIHTLQERLPGMRFMVYPTISAEEGKTKARLVLQPARPLVQYEYEVILESVVNQVGLPYDRASFTWSQCMGLPIITPKNKAFQTFIQAGDTYPVPDKITPPAPKKEAVSHHKKRNAKESIGAFDRQQALDIMMRYIEHNRDSLTDYTNALSSVLVLAKAAQDGEIGEGTARECALLLALGVPEWEQGNLAKLELELKNESITTEYTFKAKFYDTVPRPKPPTMQALKKELEAAGSIWRSSNSKVNQNTGEVKPPAPMPPYILARMLGKYIPIKLIGSEKDSAPLYVYNLDTGVYSSSETQLFELIKCLEYRHNVGNWKNIIAHLRTDAPLVDPFNQGDLIPCNNGIFDRITKQLIPFSPDYPITSKLATDYNPNASCPHYFNVDAWFHELAAGDSEIVALLWQVINEAINPNYTRKKLGFLVGEGNNGKGTFQKLLQELIGAKNVATLKPSDFKGTDGTRFRLSNLMGKTANIGDDISSAYLDDVSNLMSIATGDPITVEIKNGPTYDVTLKLFCLFSGNSMPSMRNKSEGLYRRLLIIPFNADFNGGTERPEIKERYVEDKAVLEYVLYKSINLDFKAFTVPQAVNRMVSEYKLDNDILLTYLLDHYISAGYHAIPAVPCAFVREQYRQFLEQEGYKMTIKRNGFTKDLLKGLKEQTSMDYESKTVKYSYEIQQALPTPMQRFVKPGGTAKSIFRKKSSS